MVTTASTRKNFSLRSILDQAFQHFYEFFPRGLEFLQTPQFFRFVVSFCVKRAVFCWNFVQNAPNSIFWHALGQYVPHWLFQSKNAEHRMCFETHEATITSHYRFIEFWPRKSVRFFLGPLSFFRFEFF